MLVKNQLLRRVTKSVIDLTVLGTAYWLAFLIHFEGSVPADIRDILVRSLPYVLLLKLVCLMALRVPRLTWRHVSLLEAQYLLIALTTASAILATMKLVSSNSSGFAAIPIGGLLVDYLLSVLATVFLRTGTRWGNQWLRHHKLQSQGLVKVRTVFIGAGSAGALVAREVAARPDLGIQPVGFLDDDRAKVGMIIHGLRVLGTTAALEQVVKQYDAAQAIITIGHLSGPNTRRITDLCTRCNIPTKVIPGIREMVAGRVNLSAIRDVAIEDLLRRDPVKLDNRAIAGIVKGRTVLVSGAGGSIGSELCRELCRFGPANLLLVEQAENGLFHIHRELLQQFPHVKVVPCIADICDQARVKQLFGAWRPSVVFHAAAHKHVPLMEWNPGEAVKNNIFGTRGLAELADLFGVERFVMISTDKAVNPSSIMGVSKRIAEIYIQALSRRSKTRFVTVRFGNVLGSAGSVVQIFKEQIARGGPVTVTHPDMKRFFMTIPEACQLVLQAGSMGKGGEIFILDMGEPIKIVDLARDMIRLSGLSAEDIEIRFTGLRPGEKLYEELSREEECIRKTQHPKIYIGRLGSQHWVEVDRHLEDLRDAVACAKAEKILAKLKEIVPEYVCNGSSATESPTPLAPHGAEPELVGPHKNGHADVHVLTPSLDLEPAPAAVAG
jgi:FlaA1/EpsC-like NDP-sugar epimerase